MRIRVAPLTKIVRLAGMYRAFAPMVVLVHACASGGNSTMPRQDATTILDGATADTSAVLDAATVDGSTIRDTSVDVRVEASSDDGAVQIMDTRTDDAVMFDVLPDRTNTIDAGACRPLISTTYSGLLGAASWDRPQTSTTNPQTITCPLVPGGANVSQQPWLFCNSSAQAQLMTFEVILGGTNSAAEAMLFAYDGNGVPSDVGACRVANDDRAGNSVAPALFEVEIAAGAALTVVVSGFRPADNGTYELRTTLVN